MCGRYQNRAEKQRIAEAFRVGIPPSFEILASYNIAPQTDQPIVRLNRESAERELALLRWGLIPFFAKDPKIGYSTMNARAETLTSSPTFREAMKRRRASDRRLAIDVDAAGALSRVESRHCLATDEMKAKTSAPSDAGPHLVSCQKTNF